MSRLFPIAVDQRIMIEDEGTSSSFGSEGGVYIPVIGADADGESVSDCESVISGSGDVEHDSVESKSNGLVRLDESDKLYGIIGKKFVWKLSEIGINVGVECIKRNLFNASAFAQARISSFQIFAKAVEKKNGGGGDVNIKYAWFGASKDEIDNIVMHGFSYDNIRNNGFIDHGVVLSADHSPLERLVHLHSCS